MKKLLFAILFGALLVFSVGMAQAAPFLVCDAPDPAEQITSYIVYRDGVEYATPDAIADGSLRLDLAGLASGAYIWTMEAVNVWGVSDASDPYISPSAANKPLNTRMVK